MTADEQLKQAYGRWRLAQMGRVGAEQWLEEARREEAQAQAALEALVKASPNREA